MRFFIYTNMIFKMASISLKMDNIMKLVKAKVNCGTISKCRKRQSRFSTFLLLMALKCQQSSKQKYTINLILYHMFD